VVALTLERSRCFFFHEPLLPYIALQFFLIHTFFIAPFPALLVMYVPLKVYGGLVCLLKRRKQEGLPLKNKNV